MVMAITGSVLVTNASVGSFQINMPSSNLQVVGVLSSDYVFQVVLDSGRIAVIPTNTGTVSSTYPANACSPVRRVHWTQSGQAIQAIQLSNATITYTVYYGDSPLQDSVPLEVFAGVIVKFAFSAATTVTATATFPSGALNLTGITCGMSSTEPYMHFAWATSSGQSFTARFWPQTMTNGYGNTDILPLNLPVAQTLSITATTTGSTTDTVYAFLYYK